MATGFVLCAICIHRVEMSQDARISRVEGPEAMKKPLRIWFLNDEPEGILSPNFVMDIKESIQDLLEKAGETIEPKIHFFDNPNVLTAYPNAPYGFDILLIDYGGRWWNRNDTTAKWLENAFDKLLDWAREHPGILILLTSDMTGRFFFEDLKRGWPGELPDNILPFHDYTDEEEKKILSWIQAASIREEALGNVIFQFSNTDKSWPDLTPDD